MRFLFILAKLDSVAAFIDRFDREAKGLKFLDQHPKRSGDARLFNGLTLHNRLVGIYTSLNIIRFDSEHLLKSMRGAICLERPHFHFTETLSTELGLTAKRLLQ